MTTEPPKPPISPWRLTPGRILLLVMGGLIVLYTVGALSGSLTNYQMVREAVQQQRADEAAGNATPAPAN